jgi:two-component system sensor histidine kinase BaeS
MMSLDRERIAQVMGNLLGNAVKFTPAGGRIVVEAAGGPDHVTIAVQDSGIGIAPEHLPHVFDRFWQQTGGKRRDGIGLGLAIAQGIVQAHGGLIVASSAPGEGARFEITLPLGPSAAPADAEASREGAQPRSTHPVPLAPT